VVFAEVRSEPTRDHRKDDVSAVDSSRSLAAAWPHGRRSLAFDIAIALIFTAGEVAQVIGKDGAASGPIVLGVLSGTVLALRRVAPIAVLVATIAAAGIAAAIGGHPLGLTLLVALYTAAAQCDRRASLSGMAATAATMSAISLGSRYGVLLNIAVSAGVATVIWLIGAYVQIRRGYLRALEERAADAEREREQLARIAVHEQRASIARELHDIVAHSVSVMLVGVRGARDVIRTSPVAAEETLARVETSGEQSLTELRRILMLLRDPSHNADSHPQPSLAQLQTLVAGYRDAGLPVELEIAPALPPLPDGVELSVYRLVEEALTNVLKHSHPTSVTIKLAHDDGRLQLDVADDGPAEPGASATASGHGIVGMRERVALLGGELYTGRRAGGGFLVSARLPL
jgi:signal transduction histidine kinase